MKPVVIALALTIVLIGGFFVFRKMSDKPVPVEPEPTPIVVDTTPEPLPEPIDTGLTTETAPEPEPDPEPPTDMEGGDRVVRERMATADPELSKILDYDYLINKTVTAADLIYREKNPMSQLPFLGQNDRLMVERREDNKLYLAPRNYKRYERWIKVFESLDENTMVNTYQFLYPLFAGSFESLGMQGRDWEATLSGAYDKVAAIEVPTTQPELLPAGKSFIYADSNLEALSPTQKAFIRMGPENTARIQRKLAAIKAALGQ